MTVFNYQDPLVKKSWSPETFDCTGEMSNICPQLKLRMWEFVPQSEDCLFLHVFTTKTDGADSSKRPVLFWIHGGAFMLGTGLEMVTNTTISNLVARGIVLVSIEYRLGPFGMVFFFYCCFQISLPLRF